MKAKRVTKTALGITMAAALVATSLVIPASTEEAEAATSFSFTLPTTAMDVTSGTDGKKVMTTLTQRAASEIPLIFGVNVIGGNAFNGLIYLAGTNVNENPDPYVWNYNYEEATGASLTTGIDGIAYSNIGNSVTDPNGLYQSGGGNQSFAVSVDELGGVGYAIGWRTDVIFSFNSALVDQIDTVHSWSEGDEYYRDGDEDYSPLLADVQTAGVSARLYAWTDLGDALSAYLDDHEELTTRYDDPEIIGQDVAEFSAGIPYYIASLIADGTIEKKTAAYVSAIDEYTLTVVNPADVGNVSADVYAEVQNFDFIEEDAITLTDLMENYDVDVIILGASGYGYGSSGNQAGNGGNSVDTSKADMLEELVSDLGYAADELPLIMDSNTIGVTIGNNGYNYAPTTPMFMPYVQTYAYMDELAEVNEAINPVAMVMFMFDECCHITDESVEDVAMYYIADNWDSVDDDYDQVPDTANYVYDKDAIIEAIRVGVAYALSDEAAENGNVLMPAYSSNETAFQLLQELATTEVPEDGHEYITIYDVANFDSEEVTTTSINNRTGEEETTTSTVYTQTDNYTTKYIDLTELVGTESDDEDEDSSSAGYQKVRTSYEAIVDYYNTGEYGYGDDLQTTLQNYADHMIQHVWQPDTSVVGTYAYGVTASDEDDSTAVDDSASSSAADSLAVRRGNIMYYSYTIHAGNADYSTSYGKADDVILVGDWDGDGVDTICVRRGNQYIFSNNITNPNSGTTTIYYGKATDEVLVGDWNGDGKDTLAVRRGNTYYLSYTIHGGDADKVSAYGKASDTALAGDWNGNGTDSLAVRRGNSYYLSYTIHAGDADKVVAYGKASDEVLVGAWNGNGT
ncbi:MAG: hypothetical protein LUC83_01770, partial [Clostridiales bacterium]|nr:hypothetical protein [Clostridiales bacterium]